MAAERRWNERRFILEESTTLNGGARTVFIEHMTPGTTVPPHWHEQFTETFDLIAGSLSLYSHDTTDIPALEASVQPMEIGKLASIPPGKYHKYVSGDDGTTLRAILTPGHRDFERVVVLMNGMAESGELEGLNDSLDLLAIIMDLADAHLYGPIGEMVKAEREKRGGEIDALKKRLLETYDTEEGMRKSMQK